MFLDDVIVFDRTFDEHLSRLSTVLDRLPTARLKITPAKFQLFCRVVEFLSHIVSSSDIATDLTKWVLWRSCRYQDILRIWDYIWDSRLRDYRRFIRDFATIADPLHRLLNIVERYYWSEDYDATFDSLKRRLVPTVYLVHGCLWDWYRRSPQSITGRERVVIAYYSRALTKLERQYCVTGRELLALVAVCRHFRGYLSEVRFTVHITVCGGYKNSRNRRARKLGGLKSYPNLIWAYCIGRVSSIVMQMDHRTVCVDSMARNQWRLTPKVVLITVRDKAVHRCHRNRKLIQ